MIVLRLTVKAYSALTLWMDPEFSAVDRPLIALSGKEPRQMKSLDFSRYALCSCFAAAMLAGCGGSPPPPIGAPGAMLQKPIVR